MGLRAESAADELEQICGATINVSPTVAVPSTAARTGTTCPAGYVDRDPTSATCFLDPVAFAVANATRSTDSSLLAACLGGGATTPTLADDFATLGDQPVCLWHAPGDPNALCNQPDPDESRECPFRTNEATCPVGNRDGSVPMGVTAVGPITQQLGLFTEPENPVVERPSSAELPCGLLALQRANGAPMYLSDQGILRSGGRGFLTYEGFRIAAANLSFRVGAGDYVQVMSGNSRVASTGRADDPAWRWPVNTGITDTRQGRTICPTCGTGGAPCWTPGPTADTAQLASYTGPLGCIRGSGTYGTALPDGEDRQFRARMNDLLIRAVIAARVMAGESLEDLPLPYYRPDGQRVWLEGEDFSPISGAVFQQSSAGTFVFDPSDVEEAVRTSFSDLRASAQHAVGTHEWTRCSYTVVGSAACSVFDNNGLFGETAYVDGSPSRNMPLIIQRLASSVYRDNASSVAQRLWTSSFRSSSWIQTALLGAWEDGYPAASYAHVQRMALTSDVDLASLTNYFDPRTQNAAFVARGGLTPNDFMNGLELACQAQLAQAPNPITANCASVPEFQTLRDLLRAGPYLQCVADTARDTASRSVVRGLPANVVADVQAGGSTATGQLSGEYGAEVAEIRASLLVLRVHESAMADDIRRLAGALEVAQSAVEQSEIRSEIEDIQLVSQTANQITQCVTAVASAASEAVGKFGITAGISGASAAATCVNSTIQIIAAAQINALQERAGAEEIDIALANADRSFVDNSASVRGHAIEIGAAIARIDAALTRLRALQTRARTALARAMFLDSSDTGRHFAVDTVMRRRYDTTLTRYTESQRRARRLAYIARVALEQRLGMNLELLTDDLITVDAPARWVNDICTLPAINFTEIRNATTPGDGTLPSPDGYAGAYIGDYVRRLEQVYESYSFAYPFQDGTDTAVISLRDDIMGLRRDCDVELPNLLFQSNGLDVRESATEPGWVESACLPPAVPDDAEYCVTAGPAAFDSPVTVVADRYGTPRPMVVRFGTKAVAATRYSQTVTLDAGRYRVSWWSRNGTSGQEEVRALDGVSHAPIARLSTPYARAHGMTGWYRWDYFFDVDSPRDVEIALGRHAAAPATSEITIAGVQVERAGVLFAGDVNAAEPMTMPAVTTAQRFGPGAFYDTGATRTGALPVCTDDGSVFRRRAFEPGCVTVCSNGYDGGCRDEEKIERCFIQTSINVSSDELQRLLTSSPAGFASGNYNYRFESVGVNLVGTGLRDCDREPSGGCFGAGNFSISLVHIGPFTVRNALGADYEAPLFPGRVESARALAAERYLTNPLSGADQGLIQPYVRPELQGRPLGGTLQLRIWDDDNLRIDRLEDIQLVLNYRYWTHQRR